MLLVLLPINEGCTATSLRLSRAPRGIGCWYRRSVTVVCQMTEGELSLHHSPRLGRRAAGPVLSIPELRTLEGIPSGTWPRSLRCDERAGFVRSTRGQSGRYTLARPATEIAVGEALAALGGRLYDGTFCQCHGGSQRMCTHLSECSIRPVWKQVQDLVDDVLSRLTLQHLRGSERERSARATSRAVALACLPRGG